ncbi:hypothetical protein HOA92_06340 [archaeon]|mgnify:FL=1|jgi:hypothetical protein|nr:hypothetical protein [archaeon]MBT6762630.1 hypothetical protein [archaeon]
MNIDSEYQQKLTRIPLKVIENKFEVELYRFTDEPSYGLIDFRGKVDGFVGADDCLRIPTEDAQNQLLSYAAGNGIQGIVYDFRENEHALQSLVAAIEINNNHLISNMGKAFLGIEMKQETMPQLLCQLIESIRGGAYLGVINVLDIYQNFKPHCYDSLEDGLCHLRANDLR